MTQGERTERKHELFVDLLFLSKASTFIYSSPQMCRCTSFTTCSARKSCSTHPWILHAYWFKRGLRLRCMCVCVCVELSLWFQRLVVLFRFTSLAPLVPLLICMCQSAWSHQPVGINGRIDWLCFPKLLDFAWQLVLGGLLLDEWRKILCFIANCQVIQAQRYVQVRSQHLGDISRCEGRGLWL